MLDLRPVDGEPWEGPDSRFPPRWSANSKYVVIYLLRGEFDDRSRKLGMETHRLAA